MLKHLRSGTQSVILKIFLFGILLMALAGLALMDVQGMFRNGIGNNTVAKVGKTKISTLQLDRIVNLRLRQQNIPQSLAIQAGIPVQVLQSEINNRLHSMSARDLGFMVDDVTAAKAVKTMFIPMLKENITEKDALNRLLVSLGMSEGQLMNNVKVEIATKTTKRLLTSGMHAPQQLINDAMAYQYETRRAKYFKITSRDIEKTARTPSKDDVQAHYNATASQYARPEYRNIAILLFDRKSLKIENIISTEDARAYYNENRIHYGAAESRKIAQAVAKTEEEAKAIYAAATKSNNLKTAAKETTYLDAQEFSALEMPSELAKASFNYSIKEGQILPPVQTPLGWHVLQITKITPSEIPSFKKMRKEIEKELSAGKAAEILYEKANEIDDMIAGGATAAEVAKSFGLTPTTLTKVDADGLNPAGKKVGQKIPSLQEILNQAFLLQSGEASQLIETPDGAFLLAEIQDIFLPENRPLTEVRKKVITDWKKVQARTSLDKTITDITQRIQLGHSFTQLTNDFKKTPLQTKQLMRTAQAKKEKIPARLIQTLFTLDKKGDTSSFIDGDAVYVLHFSDRRVSIPKKKDIEKTLSLKNTLERALKDDILEQYRRYLFNKYNVKVNSDTLARMYEDKEDDY